MREIATSLLVHKQSTPVGSPMPEPAKFHAATWAFSHGSIHQSMAQPNAKFASIMLSSKKATKEWWCHIYIYNNPTCEKAPESELAWSESSHENRELPEFHTWLRMTTVAIDSPYFLFPNYSSLTITTRATNVLVWSSFWFQKPKLPKQIDQKNTTRLFRGQKKKRNEQTRLRPRNCLPRRRRGNYKQIVVSENLWPILRPRETERHRHRDWKPEMQVFGNSEQKLSRIWSARGELQQNENKFALKRTRERERERERELDAARARRERRRDPATEHDERVTNLEDTTSLASFYTYQQDVWSSHVLGKKGLFTRVTTYNAGSPATPRSIDRLLLTRSLSLFFFFFFFLFSFSFHLLEFPPPNQKLSFFFSFFG
jgi:hypothetical protein